MNRLVTAVSSVTAAAAGGVSSSVEVGQTFFSLNDNVAAVILLGFTATLLLLAAGFLAMLSQRTTS